MNDTLYTESAPVEAAAPCQYTNEEVAQRVMSATADIDAGVGLLMHEDFKKQKTLKTDNRF